MSYRLFFSDLTFYFLIYFQWTFHYDEDIIEQAILLIELDRISWIQMFHTKLIQIIIFLFQNQSKAKCN